MVPVIGANGNVVGVVTEGNMTRQILSGRVNSDQTVLEAKVVYKTFRKISMNDKLSDLASALDLEPFALVVTEQRCFNGKKKTSNGNGSTSSSSTHIDSIASRVETKTVVSGIVTRIDLLDYISKNEDSASAEYR